MPALLLAFLFSLAMCCTTHAAPKTGGLNAEAVNAVSWSRDSVRKGISPALLKAQILLDRNGFSPGAIDGRHGDNSRKALSAFQEQRGLPASGKLDRKTWDELVRDAPDAVLIEYEISKTDVKGPFTADIPEKLEEKASLDGLGYRDPREMLAEKFHMKEELLSALNPGKRFDEPGTRIFVANIQSAGGVSQGGRTETTGHARRDGQNANAEDRKATRLEVDKKTRSLRAFDSEGRLLAFYPATIGSEENPAPSGTLEIVRIATNPTYHYRPSLNFKGVSERSFKIAPGPNNPVGTVWIDLSKKGYGIHGTPEPDKVSKTSSHGCIRLTNWDAEHLAKIVTKGTVVEFRD
jgi:lipoprotein-anchoring transpeptidase ErfK/SrfK